MHNIGWIEELKQEVPTHMGPSERAILYHWTTDVIQLSQHIHLKTGLVSR
ncbi:hypothetical protein L798_12433 [Zootermopsis nevadensis]|uniref:Uncharacterized protein n=1 Tax=Zootermopsis nevadensis TaxID=136037 RepID=A0A067R3U1_ZOONE|nr:hypothetical protein L798_12433 [Zootermopsis nevadensis]